MPCIGVAPEPITLLTSVNCCARAVKLASLRRLRDDHPEITLVSTSNAEENTAMRHVNEGVGFRPSQVETMASLSLSVP